MLHHIVSLFSTILVKWSFISDSHMYRNVWHEDYPDQLHKQRFTVAKKKKVSEATANSTLYCTFFSRFDINFWVNYISLMLIVCRNFK